jgi:hypothetical protein
MYEEAAQREIPEDPGAAGPVSDLLDESGRFVYRKEERREGRRVERSQKMFVIRSEDPGRGVNVVSKSG